MYVEMFLFIIKKCHLSFPIFITKFDLKKKCYIQLIDPCKIISHIVYLFILNSTSISQFNIRNKKTTKKTHNNKRKQIMKSSTFHQLVIVNNYLLYY